MGPLFSPLWDPFLLWDGKCWKIIVLRWLGSIVRVGPHFLMGLGLGIGLRTGMTVALDPWANNRVAGSTGSEARNPGQNPGHWKLRTRNSGHWCEPLRGLWKGCNETEEGACWQVLR
jgi:hypothetical protein